MDVRIYFPHLEHFHQKDESSHPYGEIFSSDFMNFMQPYLRNQPHPYMLDVGSGCGRFAEYVSKHGGFPVDGVEIDIDRFEKSQKQKKFNTEFIYGHFEKINFEPYSILYCCNLFFTEEDNQRLCQKIEKEFKGLCILYTRPFPDRFYKRYFVKTSWNLNQDIYLIFF